MPQKYRNRPKIRFRVGEKEIQAIQETTNGYEHLEIKCIIIRPDTFLRILNQNL